MAKIGRSRGYEMPGFQSPAVAVGASRLLQTSQHQGCRRTTRQPRRLQVPKTPTIRSGQSVSARQIFSPTANRCPTGSSSRTWVRVRWPGTALHFRPVPGRLPPLKRSRSSINSRHTLTGARSASPEWVSATRFLDQSSLPPPGRPFCR